MLKLYTAPTPNGRKASIALEELELPYEVVRVDIHASEHPTPEFLAITPNHKIPAIDDDGLVIWESGAILLHLAEKHGKLLPADPAGAPPRSSTPSSRPVGSGPTWGASAVRCVGPRPSATRR